MPKEQDAKKQVPVIGYEKLATLLSWSGLLQSINCNNSSITMKPGLS